ncbi:HXXEE domain-containing protein [Paenibacillus spiritus]|uniref:HXXEE domain-containing protein n=1 Tax=Paenibacillus spiritus TaxID=2496557 RepID=A0A5J5GLM5_9BACL|nr:MULTISPECIES: HXXEE domain-containing protein [Paenibacillus]KAA9008558.1 HXXEE domain-containing protein [Paenibacillus spiritus]
MLDTLNAQIGSSALIWLFLAAFIIHDFEEIIFMEGWTQKHGAWLISRLPAPAARIAGRYGRLTGSRFAVPVLFEFIAFVPITFAAAERQHYAFFLGINAVMFIHVFTHLGHAILLRRYTPGVVTAVLIALPYSAYLFYRLTDEGLVSWKEIWMSLPYGAILIPLVGFGYLAGKYLAPAREA